MKALVVFLLTFGLTQTSPEYPESLKFSLGKFQEASLPYIRERGTFPHIRCGMNKDIEKVFPLYGYNDLNGKIPFYLKNNRVYLFQKFATYSDKFQVIALEVGISDQKVMMLTTINRKTYEIIDWIEVEIACIGTRKMFSKEWALDEKLEVEVYHIIPVNPNTVYFSDHFTSFEGQRVDTHFSIDQEGRFHQTGVVQYRPQTYTREYLTDINKSIRTGNETMIQKIISLDEEINKSN